MGIENVVDNTHQHPMEWFKNIQKEIETAIIFWNIHFPK